VPIPGTTKLHPLEKNLAAADVELTADSLAEIKRAASEIDVEGERYPEHLMKTTGPPASERQEGWRDAASAAGVVMNRRRSAR
jgi:hypothetical protein